MTEKIKTEQKSDTQTMGLEQLQEIGEQRHDVLRVRLEQAEQKHEHNSRKDQQEQAAREATELAKDPEKESVSQMSPAERRRGAPSKKQRATSLQSQLKQVQTEMSTNSRALSKVIHNKQVEHVSDLASSTIARPNALLSGSIAAFIGVTICYFVAKYYGYQLSGFETIAAFIFGWGIGVLYDYFLVMIRGHRKDR